MDFILDNIRWFVAGGIVVIGLFVLGIKDLARFSISRAWAISGVCFDESIRRRVLWITPLAILGVIIVSQLTKPIDAQDAIRQTTKFCLFATGLLVVITTIILACTNLPKEIENRVIFTVVTKPTTRLEIIVGKVLGFARVSAAILLIMGLFTFVYLQLRAWNIQRELKEMLATLPEDHPARPTLAFQAGPNGILATTSLEYPETVQVFGRPLKANEPVRWMSGAGEGSVNIQFKVSRDDLMEGSQPTTLHIVVDIDAIHSASAGQGETLEIGAVFDLNPEPSSYGPRLAITAPPDPATQETAQGERPNYPVFANVSVSDVTGQYHAGGPGIGPFQLYRTPDGFRGTAVLLPQTVEVVRSMLPQQGSGILQVGISGVTDRTLFGVRDNSVRLIVPSKNGELPAVKPEFSPMMMFQGREGSHGQQVKGDAKGAGSVGHFTFRNVEFDADEQGNVPFELRSGIERSGEDLVIDDDDFTNVNVSIVDPQTQAVRHTMRIRPGSNRPVYFSVPKSVIGDGNFDLTLKVLSSGHWLGIRYAKDSDQVQASSLALVSGRQNFAFNLFKSLLILWLMSLLVIIVSIFCSTFLSWPIAIVLTLVILLGHWGVEQIADVATPGIGRRIAQEWLPEGDVAQVRVISSSVEALSRLLDIAGKVLPDITQFEATTDIERGVTIPMKKLGQSLLVIVAFGLPIMVLSYVFLKNKEVAP